MYGVQRWLAGRSSRVQTNSTGAGDPSRTLALLWRTNVPDPARRGPRRALQVDDVVTAATDLADGDGLGAVTMRSIAEALGVATMSVYTYVPGKAELIDLMVDSLYLRMPRPAWRRSGWRTRLTRVADANRTLLTDHLWLTEVAALSRPPLGPGLMAKYDHELGAFDGTGLDDIAVDSALTYLLGFVQSHVRSAHDAARATTDSAMTDAQWWAANQPLLERALDPDAYPRAVRIGAASGAANRSAWDDERAWRFGLARTLDGLGALIEAPRRRGSRMDRSGHENTARRA
jgi:AcrR family transcriptional regulator